MKFFKELKQKIIDNKKKIGTGVMIAAGGIALVGGAALIVFPPTGVPIAAIGLTAVAVDYMIKLAGIALVTGGAITWNKARESHVNEKERREERQRHQTETTILRSNYNFEAQRANAQTAIVIQKTSEIETYKAQLEESNREKQDANNKASQAQASISKAKDEINLMGIDEDIIELEPEKEEAVNDAIHNQTRRINKHLNEASTQLSKVGIFKTENRNTDESSEASISNHNSSSPAYN